MPAPLKPRSNAMQKGGRIDFASLLGLLAGPGFILLGQHMEGGSIGALLQKSAALIVLGATVASCAVSFSQSYLWAAMRDLRKVISEDTPDPYDLIERVVRYATVLRKEGPIALQKYAREERYAMLSTGLNLIISNTPEESMATIMERAFHERVRLNNAGAEVFEAAGGYLPTFGILGAVLGLIHTMGNLADPSKVGEGIATAFVATVYGVGFANLIAYPVARKIRTRAISERQLDRLVVTGIEGLRAGMIGTPLRQLMAEGLHFSSGGQTTAAAEGSETGRARAA